MSNQTRTRPTTKVQSDGQPAYLRPKSRSVATPDLVVPNPPSAAVLRPRLFDLLDRGSTDLLTLVCAPAGCGKTALLSSWLAERPKERVGWLSLRRGGGEAIFWAELLEAIQRLVPPSSLLGRLAPPRVATPARFVVQFLNGFAELDEQITLVIDDFHVMHWRGVLDGLEQLLQAAPDSLRLVISTRHDPALPLHLLRASGELTEIRGHDLAFAEPEARELLAGMQVNLVPAEFEVLLDRTEGWAAGLRLFTLSQRNHSSNDMLKSFALDERPATEYLAAEVLARQPDDVREFLLKTSIVERITPQLAEALTDRADSAHELERLVANNLFIDRFDGHPPRYRYHQLFAELLRAEYQLSYRAALPDLHARAARWYFDEGESLEALQHALAADDLELLTQCMIESWFDLFARTDIPLRGDLLATLLKGKVDRSPELSAVVATIEFGAGSTRRAARRVQSASALLPSSADPRAQAIVTFAELLGHSFEGRCSESARLSMELLELSICEPFPPRAAETLRTIALGHLGVAELHLGLHDDAETHLNEAVELSRGADIPYTELGSVGGLAWLEYLRGHFRRAARVARTGVELAETRGLEQTHQASLSYATLAAVEYEWDDLDATQIHARRLAEIAHGTNDRVAKGLSLAIEASLCLTSGGESLALGLQHIRGARAETAQVESPSLRQSIAGLEVRLLTATGERDEAATLIERALRQDPENNALRAVRARLLLAGGDPDAALAELEPTGAAASPVVAVEQAALRSLAYRVKGSQQEMLDAFSETLTLAEPENMRQQLLGLGLGLRDLLSNHLRHKALHRWFAGELVRRLDGNEAGGAMALELLEPLSRRELEVLRYLPTMMSNADIGAELFVSVNTVKTHVKSIYRKLDASRRQEAVRRARQLQLL